MSANYTPIPWEVGSHPRDGSGTEWREILAPSRFGPTYVGQALAPDAEFVVRAVNSHDALVAALRGMVNAYAPRAEQIVAQIGKDALHSDVRRALEILTELEPKP